MSGFICSNNQYFYKRWYFEYHKYHGPWPLNKNGDPRKRAGEKFWEIWAEFSKLTEDEKNKHLTHKGGCQRF